MDSPMLKELNITPITQLDFMVTLLAFSQGQSTCNKLYTLTSKTYSIKAPRGWDVMPPANALAQPSHTASAPPLCRPCAPRSYSIHITPFGEINNYTLN